MKLLKTYFLIFLLIGSTALIAQDYYSPVELKIGEPMPDILLNLNYVNAGQTSVSKLRGKPLVLDFISKYCVSCFRSLPEANELNKKYGDKINIILMGNDNYTKDLQHTYEELRATRELSFPVHYDSTTFKRFGMRWAAFVVYVDKHGIIEAITGTLERESLELFAEGKKFPFKDYSKAGEAREVNFDHRQPFQINDNGWDDEYFVQRSVLTKWRDGIEPYVIDESYKGENPLLKVKMLQVLCVDVRMLYRIAYFGRATGWQPYDTTAYRNYIFNPVLELRDSSGFAGNYNTGSNQFCYSQVLAPEKRTPENMMRQMQQDLKSYFGYEARMETRELPYLRLVATKESRKKLKADMSRKDPTTGDEYSGGQWNNMSIAELILIISNVNGLTGRHLPLLDETGIVGNIDIDMVCSMTNLEDVKRKLRESGLDILPGKKLMKVIVIRDPKADL